MTGGCTPWYYPRSIIIIVITVMIMIIIYVIVIIIKFVQSSFSLDTNICDPWQTKVFLEAIFGGVTADRCVD